MDPDPEGRKTCGSGGSGGSGTLPLRPEVAVSVPQHCLWFRTRHFLRKIAVHSSRQCPIIITVMQDKENMDPEVIKQTVSELQQSSLKVTEQNYFIIFRFNEIMLNLSQKSVIATTT
jgi:hypothetical protein